MLIKRADFGTRLALRSREYTLSCMEDALVIEQIRKNLQLVIRGERVGKAIVELDRVVAANRDALPGQLSHYLQRRSYRKAAEALDVE